MIKDDRENLYIGVTDNPQRRLFEHNSKRGASYTKTKDLFRIVFLEEHLTLASSRSREIQLKKWRRDKKEFLIQRYQQGLPTKISKT